MMYIYDTAIAPHETTLRRYGGVYTLKNISRMESQRFFLFESPGREPILVVPRFVEQFNQVDKILQRYRPAKKAETALAFARKHIDRHAVMEDVPNNDSESGMTQIISCHYQDIQVQLEYIDCQLRLMQEFEILDKNLFGNGIVVSMNFDMEGS